MNRGFRMMAMNNADNKRGERRGEYNMDDYRNNSRYRGETEYETNRMEYNGSGMNYGGVEGRFRDRRGREHYDDGRFSPMRNEYNEEDSIDNYRDRESPIEMPGHAARNEMRRIGFNSYGEEFDNEYRMGADYPHMQEAMYMGGSERMSGHSSGAGGGEGLDRRTAEQWTRKMKNTDGSRGPRWSFEQTKQMMRSCAVDCDPVEFYATVNMISSDYGKVLKKFGVGDRLDLYCELAKAFLDDKDAVPDKLSAYYEYVVKK